MDLHDDDIIASEARSLPFGNVAQLDFCPVQMLGTMVCEVHGMMIRLLVVQWPTFIRSIAGTI